MRQTPQGGRPTDWRFSHQSESSEPQARHPSPGVLLIWEDEPPEHWLLKASGAYFQESQRTLRNRPSTLKGHSQNLTIQDSGQMQSFERRLSQTYLQILKSFLERQEATGAHPKDIDTGTAVSGSSFYHANPCGQAPFWSPPYLL